MDEPAQPAEGESVGQQYGTSMGMVNSPARTKRVRAARKRQEQRWAALAGPVEVRRKEDVEAAQEAGEEGSGGPAA
jgi:hypothetical protein